MRDQPTPRDSIAEAVTASVGASSPVAHGPAREHDHAAENDHPGREAMRLEADEPTANYAVRVRRSLDDLVAWRLAELRRRGVRASKVELTEMLLWELADEDIGDIITRLERFRAHARR
jgi:hypothetical protein